MNCEVFTSSRSRSRFAIVPIDKPLPNELKDEFGGQKSGKIIFVEEGKRLLGLDSSAALRDIQRQGYHIAEPGVLFEEHVA